MVRCPSNQDNDFPPTLTKLLYFYLFHILPHFMMSSNLLHLPGFRDEEMQIQIEVVRPRWESQLAAELGPELTACSFLLWSKLASLIFHRQFAAQSQCPEPLSPWAHLEFNLADLLSSSPWIAEVCKSQKKFYWKPISQAEIKMASATINNCSVVLK